MTTKTECELIIEPISPTLLHIFTHLYNNEKHKILFAAPCIQKKFDCSTIKVIVDMQHTKVHLRYVWINYAPMHTINIKLNFQPNCLRKIHQIYRFIHLCLKKHLTAFLFSVSYGDPLN